MSSWSDSAATYYAGFCAVSVLVLKAVNEEVLEPYMVRAHAPESSQHRDRQRVPLQDEPFHVPQAQAYCRGDYWSWDPKITTPPGL